MSGSATVTQPGAVEMIFKAVERIFKSEGPNQPEPVHISLKGGEKSVISGGNMLTDKSVPQVHLNPGAQVENTIRARAAAIGSPEKWPGTPDGKQN
jgi:hypothetical protein